MAFPGVSPSQSVPGPSGVGDPQWCRSDFGGAVAYYNATNFQTINNKNAGGNQSGNYWFNPNSFSNAREVALNQALVNGGEPIFAYEPVHLRYAGAQRFARPGRVQCQSHAIQTLRGEGEIRSGIPASTPSI